METKELIIYLVIALASLGTGILIGRMLLQKIFKSEEIKAHKKAEQIIKQAELEGEKVKNEKIFQSKEKFLELKNKLDEEVRTRKGELTNAENRVKQKEQILNQKYEQVKREENEIKVIRENISKQLEIVKQKQEETEKLRQQQVSQLEKIAGLSPEDAKQRMMEQLKAEAKTKADGFIKMIMDEAKTTANKESKRIVVQAIQRLATEHAIENSVSVINIENDEIKGRIIGREGRNIRALEAATGVEIIVDDTPEAIILSSFDPVRREIARLAIQKLIADGRIHPARIEEIVAKISKSLDEDIAETGERTVIDLGIHGLHKEMTKLVGRMKYRSSYGQNLLHHSREVANLCAIMASELGMNVKRAKRAGLLHDIGKVSTEDPETPHALLGMKLAQRYGEPEDVCNAIGAHHDEIEMTVEISPLVQAADAISGSRPGARREVMESYIKRLKDLETVALSYPGVSKTYAMMAGRELRVIVESEKVSDEQADTLSHQISTRIQEEMQYPGQIKVTVIREKRAVSYAK